MDQRHLDEGIDVERIAMIDEPFEIAHRGDDDRGILGRHVDGLPGGILERSARQLPESGAVLLELGLDLQDVVEDKQAGFLDHFEPDAEGLPISMDLLRSRALRDLGIDVFTKELVVGGDDVFDRGAVLRLTHAEGVDEDSLVWDRSCHSLQLGELPARASQPAQNDGRIESGGPKTVERRNTVKWRSAGQVTAPSPTCIGKRAFLYTSRMTCIENGTFLYASNTSYRMHRDPIDDPVEPLFELRREAGFHLPDVRQLNERQRP